ncbi:TIGR03756 family integrating conjugative element protein [Marinobacter fuscus]|jgi:integrating conjugative element protein (TIGR03756 family)|uniref:Integrating conjugative element protein n=3 Tax=Gammaproteobacteria TaxID=1236 RepID=A0A6F8XHU2_9GAMM|nr:MULTISPECIES: TIGR03756 family integrating conjugative element protein [Gammaproteobacteria]MAH32557.1 TIGR03756 family integrating conjugative element protein [Marinobacter sp.]MEB3736060.1 TIGR03756 family integrating conjugative element protein [Halopseudomonas pachastrellae]OUW78699.1 MAG: integrating conjugative element protein [Saprospirales bacterium TMED214]MBU41542.1 TIGR03756 family integrating conjugative element protein [Marinobacter sp.]MCC4261194.1 TIGR03756 family integrating|tara:strand:+ start:1819 stop:2751 length:933 start_codon:yes stop_codon:yes gene_type:complete
MIPRRLRLGAAAVLLCSATSSFALNTATIISSTLSPDCLEYRVTGICYWLYCSLSGCSVRTSIKVRHYVPDAVVSSYSNTGQNPWIEVRPMSPPTPSAQAGGDGTTNEDHENNLAKFKNADVIGHPGGQVFSQFASASGYICQGAGTAFMPYLLSTFDTLAWRYNMPEAVYPESLIPGMREIGTRTRLNLWGNVYPRGGFLHQADDYKAGAVVAQRAGDVVTRRGQLHVYQPLMANARDGYWPAGALIESDASTGKWQRLTPRLSNTCTVFPHAGHLPQAQQGDYAWALWRPYSCCQRRGQVFLGSVDFN